MYFLWDCCELDGLQRGVLRTAWVGRNVDESDMGGLEGAADGS